MQQQTRFPGFLQGRLKRRDEFMRQIANKANGVDEDDWTTDWLLNTPQGRVEGREQLIGYPHPGIRESIE